MDDKSQVMAAGFGAAIGAGKRTFRLKDPSLHLLLVSLDLAVLCLAFYVSLFLRFNPYFGIPLERRSLEFYVAAFLVIVAIAIAIFHYLGLYLSRAWRYSELFFHLVIAVFLTLMIFSAIAYGMRVFYHRLILV